MKDVVADLGWDWHRLQFDVPAVIKVQFQSQTREAISYFGVAILEGHLT